MYRVGSSIKKTNQIRKSYVVANSTIRNYASDSKKTASNKERYSEFVDFDEEDLVLDTRKKVEKKVEVVKDVKDFDEMLAKLNMKDLKLMRYRENPEIYELFKKMHVDINDAFQMKITTKSLLEKEKLKSQQELKGSQFKTQKVTYDNIANIKTGYIANELNKFKESYEKPLVEMYNEVINQQNLLFRTKRAEERLLKKKLQMKNKKYKLGSLERHYRDVVQIRNALDFRGKTILAEKDEEDAWQRLVERTEISDPHNLSRSIMADEYNDLGFQTEIDEEYINLLSINPFDFANPNSYASVVRFLDNIDKEYFDEEEDDSLLDNEQITELENIDENLKAKIEAIDINSEALHISPELKDEIINLLDDETRAEIEAIADPTLKAKSKDNFVLSVIVYFKTKNASAATSNDVSSTTTSTDTTTTSTTTPKDSAAATSDLSSIYTTDATLSESTSQIEQYLSEEEKYKQSLVENYEFYKQMNRPSVSNAQSIANLLEVGKISINAGSRPLTEQEIVDLLPYEEEVVEEAEEPAPEEYVNEFEDEPDDNLDELLEDEEEEIVEREVVEKDGEKDGEKDVQVKEVTESAEQQVSEEGEVKDVKVVKKSSEFIYTPENDSSTVDAFDADDQMTCATEDMIGEEDIELLEDIDKEDEEMKKLREIATDLQLTRVEEIPDEKKGVRGGSFGLRTTGLKMDVEPNLEEYIHDAVLDLKDKDDEWLGNLAMRSEDRDLEPLEEKMYEPSPNNLPDLEALSAKIRKAEEEELSLIADKFINVEVNEKTAHDLVDQIFESYKKNNLFHPDIIEHDRNVIREANGDVAVPDSMYFEYDTTFRDLVDRDVVFKMPLKDTDLVRVLTHQLTESGLLKQEKVLKYSPDVMPVSQELVQALPDRFPDFVQEILNQDKPKEEEYDEEEYEEESATVTSTAASTATATATTTESDANTNSFSSDNQTTITDADSLTVTGSEVHTSYTSGSSDLSTLSLESLEKSENEIYDERRLYINLKPAIKDEGVLTLPTVNKKEKWVDELLEEEKHDGWLMGKPFDMLSYRLNGQESTISSKRIQENKLYDEEMDEEGPLIEELVDEEDDDYRDLSPGCDQEPELFEETELFHYLQQGKDQEWFRPDRIGDDDIKALEARQTWVPNQKQHIYTYPIQFVTTSGTTDQTKQDSWVNRKAIMKVNIKAFNLAPCVEQRLIELTGKRFDPYKNVLTLVANNHKTINENKYEVKRVFRELLHEASLADPNFISTRTDNFKPAPPPLFVPSDAAKKQPRFNIYRIQGSFPILSSQIEKQFKLSSFIQKSLSD